ALGAWFLLQLGLSLWPGMAAALAVYTVLLLFHLLVRRSLIDGGGSEAREEMQWMAGEPELPGLGRDRRERAPPHHPVPAAGRAGRGGRRRRRRGHLSQWRASARLAGGQRRSRLPLPAARPRRHLDGRACRIAAGAGRYPSRRRLAGQSLAVGEKRRAHSGSHRKARR